ncbi:MAG: penicillin acylase family protein [Spirochaetia bacterium]|nr:penicillin acylase family protein [Spirochaetia bacterium]
MAKNGKKENKKSDKKKAPAKKPVKKTKRKYTQRPKPVTEEEMKALFGAVSEIEEENRKARRFYIELYKWLKKRKKKTFIFAAIFLSLVTTYFYISYVFNAALPIEEGSLKLNGLKESVSVQRDSLGIPYIKAKNEDDLFLAAGYVMASERLWQMTTMTLLSQGRISEITGSEGLSADLFMRTIGIKRYAEKTYENMPSHIQKIFENFAKGVNAYIENAKHLPPEFILSGHVPEKWRGVDSLYISTFLNFTISFNMVEELSFLSIAQKTGVKKAAYLFPVYHDEPLPFDEAGKINDNLLASIDIKLPFSDENKLSDLMKTISLPASNNWALSPQKTGGAYSLLANDTHLFMTMPSVWFIMNLDSPEYRAGGVAFPGIPLIGLGYNGHIAWGASMVMADNQDIFLEKLSEKDGKKYYLYKGVWTPVLEVEEMFHVRGKEPVKVNLEFTRHGPLLNEIFSSKKENPLKPFYIKSEIGISHRWSTADSETTPLGIYKLGRAKTIEEAREALSYIDGMYFNMLIADRENIAWQVTGKYPIRKKGRGLLPSPGWSGEYEWEGYHPFEKNPFVLNPEKGYVAMANNKFITEHPDFTASSSWYSHDRVKRIEQMIENEPAIDYEKTKIMQYDSHSLLAESLKRLLFEKSFHETMSQKASRFSRQTFTDYEKGLEIIKNFDGYMKKNSIGAAYVGCFYHSLSRNLFGDELFSEDNNYFKAFLAASVRSYSALQDHILQREESPFWDNIKTSAFEDKIDIMAISLAEAYGLCEEKLGGDEKKWRWGDLHGYTWEHSFSKISSFFESYFNRGPYPASGDFHTVNVAGYLVGENFSVFHIPAMRFIVDFNKRDPAYLVTHSGQSGNPQSEHYDDMVPHFLSGENHPLPFAAENIEKQYNKKLIFKPR